MCVSLNWLGALHNLCVQLVLRACVCVCVCVCVHTTSACGVDRRVCVCVCARVGDCDMYWRLTLTQAIVIPPLLWRSVVCNWTKSVGLRRSGKPGTQFTDTRVGCGPERMPGIVRRSMLPGTVGKQHAPVTVGGLSERIMYTADTKNSLQYQQKANTHNRGNTIHSQRSMPSKEGVAVLT